MKGYEYKPLDLSKDAIRILRLHRGQGVNEIRCDLFEAYLHEVNGVSYEALSYAWGDQADEDEILLDGKAVLVTKNLFEALRSIRLSCEDKILWVDALCIDQENKLEKGHQVARMRHIYEYAEQTIIWLGPSSADINLLMDSALELNRRGHEMGTNNWLNVWRTIVNETNNTNFRDRRIAGLKEMLARAWFRRVWIIQEVAVAKRATLLCGSRSIPIKIFASLPNLMGQAIDPHVQAVMDVMPGPSRRKGDSWWNKDRDLRSLLMKFRDSQSSDPHDFVYALLGISSDFEDNSIIPPNYELSLDDMIRHVIWALLFNEALDQSKYNLPTWTKADFLRTLDNPFSAILEGALSMSQGHILKRLHNYTGNIPIVDPTPLHSLIKEEATSEVVGAFINLANPDVNSLDEGGQTPLQLVVASLFSRLTDTEKILPREIDGREACDYDLEILTRQVDHDDDHIGGSYRDTGLLPEFLQKFTIIETLLQHKDIEIPYISDSARELLQKATNSDDYVALLALMAVYWTPDIEPGAQEERATVALVQASAAGHVPAVRMLLGKGTPTYRTHQLIRRRVRRTALCAAVMYEHVQVIELLLQSGANINAEGCDSDGATPLWLAVKVNKVKVIRLLLEHGADIDEIGAEHQTPLTCAVELGHTDAIAILLDNGANVNGTDSDGATPLWLAARRNMVGTIQLLLEHGADIDKTDAHHQTPLGCAVSYGHAGTIFILLENGANLNHPCSISSANNLLWDAIGKRNLRRVKLILRSDIDVENRNKQEMTPLSYSVKLGDYDLVQLLLSAGANIDHIGHNKLVPLLSVLTREYYYCHWGLMGPEVTKADEAIRWNPHVIMAFSLCSANIRRERNGAQTVISAVLTVGVQSLPRILKSAHDERSMHAVYEDLTPDIFSDGDGLSRELDHTLTITFEDLGDQRFRIYQELLHYKPNLEARDKCGETILWSAVCRAYTDLVKLLLEHGADVEAADTIYETTPLWVAALLGFHDIIRLLLEKGANTERRCRKEQTPLCVAAEKGCGEAVQVLLAYGADRQAKDAQGRTPHEIALSNGHYDIADDLGF